MFGEKLVLVKHRTFLVNGEEEDSSCKNFQHALHVLHHTALTHHDYGYPEVHYCPTMIIYCRKCWGMAKEPEPYSCTLWGETKNE